MIPNTSATGAIEVGANSYWENSKGLWDNERLVGVGKPEGNWEVRCYRAGGGTSCSGAWTGQLTSVLQAADSSGGGWVEMTQYTYWPDGTVKTQVDSVNNSGTPEVRRSQTFAVDAHRRPTFSSVGTSGEYKTAAGFDGADNRIAAGQPFNSPPAWCRATGGSDGSAGALSRLCAQFGYDRANRLRQLDLFADASSGTPTRACIDYDAQGNVSRVTTGCGTGDTCSMEATPSTCGGSVENSHDYKTDDFGNVVEVKLSGTSDGSSGRGVFRYEFDARGNLLASQTVAQAAANIKHAHEYDALNRKLVTYEYHDTTPYILAEWVYDDNGDAAPAGCETDNAMGRLRRVRESTGEYWYAYDAEGRVVREASGNEEWCAETRSLELSYTPNGNLQAMKYQLGREVTYAFGDGGAADRVTAVSINWFQGDGGTTTRPLLNDVKWEPWGELRSYALALDVDGGATVDYEKGAAATAYTGCPSGALGEANDESGRLRSLRVSYSGGQVFRQSYRWQGDFVTKQATCYGTSDFLEAEFGYNGLGQLVSAVNTTEATMAGPFHSKAWAHDARGNLLSQQVAPSQTYVYSYDAGTPAQRDWLRHFGSDAWNGYAVSHDRDGRVTRLAGPKDSSDAGWRMEFDYVGSGTPTPGSNSVFREVTVTQPNGGQANYTYWYDSKRRRVVKEYPVGNNSNDYFFYGLGHQLLIDSGKYNLMGHADIRIHDEYGLHPVS